MNTPKGLSNAVFFYAGKVCCLRGGEEQRNLKPSQFVRSTSGPNMYEYIENGSKNRSGGLAQLRVENKIVKIHAVPENEPRCLVFLLDRYFAKLPKYAFDADVFYLRPKVKTPSCPDEPWYDSVAIGKNKLAVLMKNMSIQAGLDELKSNHSLRATGTTALFAAGVPEKIIQKNTGHRSIEALRIYEHVSKEQHEAATCRVLTSLDHNASFSKEISKTAISKESMGKSSENVTPAFDPNFSSLFHGCNIGSVNIQFGGQKS